MTPAPNFGDQPQRIEPTALESLQRAEFDVQIATAKRYPRKLGIVKQDMLSFATLDQETAESCFYTLPRGGKNIQGPSVRLAEIAVSCFGNLRVGSRVITTVTDGPNPHVVIQSVCHDLEKNVAVTMEKRRRITKKKSKDFIDEDDINLACNAGAAIAFRDAVFKVVPLALVKPVYEQAKMVAIGDAKTLVDRRSRMIETFGKMGVTKDMILSKLEKKTLDDVDLADIGTLIGLHTALKDGDTTIEEIFSPPKVAKPVFEEPKPQFVTGTNAKIIQAAIEGATAEPFVPNKTLRVDDPHPAIPTGAPSPEAESVAKQISEKANIPLQPISPEQSAKIQADAIARQIEAEPKKKTKAELQLPPSAKERFLEAGVSFDDFTDWCVTTGREPKAKEWYAAAMKEQEEDNGALTPFGFYSHVPDQFWKALEMDAIGVGKAITLYGAKNTYPPPQQ